MSKDDVSVERGEVRYPSKVRQMLMKRSAPHPAMRKTPTGGTRGEVSKFWSSSGEDEIPRIVMMMMRSAEMGLTSAMNMIVSLLIFWSYGKIFTSAGRRNSLSSSRISI